MNSLKDIGFVIKRVNLFDCDRFVTIFTQKHGKIDVLAKGVRKITSRRSPHIELLNLIRFQTVKTRKNYILSDAEVINTFSDLKQDYQNVGIIFLICELVDKLCPIGVAHREIFDLIENTVNELNIHNSHYDMFDFQVKLITFLGYWDEKRKFHNTWEIDRYIENIIEKKIRTKTFFKL